MILFSRPNPPCNCGAYSFPHRSAGGKCPGGSEHCASCHEDCTNRVGENRSGDYDGPPSYYSLCCEAEVIDSFTLETITSGDPY